MTGLDERVSARGFGRFMIPATLVLAVAAAVVLAVGSDDAKLLRLGVVAALWAALCGAFASVRLRREVGSDSTRAEDLREIYHLELEREIAARQEHALTVETEVRRQVEEESRDELEALRGELRILRENLEVLLDGQLLVERVALHAESTRVRSLSEGGTGRNPIGPRSPAPRPARRSLTAGDRPTAVMTAHAEPQSPQSPQSPAPPYPPPPEPTPTVWMPAPPHRSRSEEDADTVVDGPATTPQQPSRPQQSHQHPSPQQQPAQQQPTQHSSPQPVRQRKAAPPTASQPPRSQPTAQPPNLPPPRSQPTELPRQDPFDRPNRYASEPPPSRPVPRPNPPPPLSLPVPVPAPEPRPTEAAAALTGEVFRGEPDPLFDPHWRPPPEPARNGNGSTSGPSSVPFAVPSGPIEDYVAGSALSSTNGHSHEEPDPPSGRRARRRPEEPEPADLGRHRAPAVEVVTSGGGGRRRKPEEPTGAHAEGGRSVHDLISAYQTEQAPRGRHGR